MTDVKWQWAIRAAILWYCTWAILFILAKPGFHYDEAIDVRGSVHMLHSHEDMKLPHAPQTWACVRGHCFPIMSARYIGAVKEYLVLPLFAIFGPHAGVVRLLAMTLGALGFFGIATLLGKQIGYPVAAAGAWVLAVNPSYLDMTVLDNSAFSPWMAAFGLLCLAAAAYLEKQSPRAAFWVGAAMGFGIWARANYIWMVGALSLAILIAVGRKLFANLSHWIAFTIGGIVGGLPFLVYQVLSGGGTWEAVSMFNAAGTLTQRLQHRIWMLSETVLSNGEHHRIWGGPVSLPAWQLWLFPTLIFAACVVCIFLKQLLPRIAALTFLFFMTAFAVSALPIGEHHIVTLVPIAVIVVVCAGRELMHRSRIAVALIAATYLGCALYWQSAALAGLRKTGGVGPWSDGDYALADRLRADFPNREIKILDWGLQDNLFVLSNGQLHTRELFWDSTENKTDWNGPWLEEIRRGGVFVMNGPQNRQIPATTVGFLRALDQGRPTVRRYTIPQRSGIPYAEVIEIIPNTLGTGPAPPPPPVVHRPQEIFAKDANFEKTSTGFYVLEQGGWRWTSKSFSLTIPNATSIGVHVNVPDVSIQKLGPITLTIRAGNHTLAPETFSHPGDYTITRALDPAWPSRIDFQLDKTLPPRATDTRALGIIFVSARLDGV